MRKVGSSQLGNSDADGEKTQARKDTDLEITFYHTVGSEWYQDRESSTSDQEKAVRYSHV